MAEIENANHNRCLFCCFCANCTGFSACSSVVRALINSCASVKPHSVIEIYMLVAPILSPAAMARTIFSRSSSVLSFHSGKLLEVHLEARKHLFFNVFDVGEHPNE